MTSQLPSGFVQPAPPAGQVRLLRRSRADRVIGGVCGGLGRYLGVDPLLMRIAAVALALSGGAGVLAYIIAWIAIPEADIQQDENAGTPVARSATVTVLVGGVLLALGAVLLVRQVVPWLELGVIWPLVLLAVGVLVITSAVNRRR